MRSTPVCVLLVGSLFTALPEVASADDAAWETVTAERMSTRITVSLPAERIGSAQLVFDAFREVEDSANEWKPGSPIAEVNAAAGGDPTPVPQDSVALVVRGLEIGAVTDGAFDITWAALWGLWDFRAAHPALPDPTEIARRLPLIDHTRVEVDVDAGTVRLPVAGMKLGLGGIAKGRALDLAAARLRNAGIPSYMMSAGGQVAVGTARGDRPWRVGIRDPRGPADDFFAIVQAERVSVSTSGDYEHWFVHEGTRYHHILDPRTGRPARGLRSATVVAADATLADALSTAVFVLGRERGLSLVASLDDVEAAVVDDAGKVWASPGLKEALVLIHVPAPEH